MLKALVRCVFILVIFTKVAHAYIDPGSGSFIFQMLIAGLIAAFFAIKLFFRKTYDRMKNFFKKETKIDS